MELKGDLRRFDADDVHALVGEHEKIPRKGKGSLPCCSGSKIEQYATLAFFGSLALGATLAVIAILIKQEFLLFTVAGVFILEALSVVIQVGYFKLSGGKRVFRMAPLHHHFELIGWNEEQVVVRFWIAAIIFALFSLTTLKLR